MELKDEEIPLMVKALISAYEAHIQTLKGRIKELESQLVVNGAEPLNSKDLNLIANKYIPRPVLRTTSQIIKAMEKRTLLDMNKEVKESDVK